MTWNCVVGRDGEEYQGIRKDAVHLAGRLTVADDRGPFGNPTSDSARTMVTPETTRLLVIVFAPRAVGAPAVARALELTARRTLEYCGGTVTSATTIESLGPWAEYVCQSWASRRPPGKAR